LVAGRALKPNKWRSRRSTSSVVICNLLPPLPRGKVFGISLGCDVHLRLPPKTLECQPGLRAATFLHGILFKSLCCNFGLPSCAAITTNILGPQHRLYAYFDAIYATLEIPDANMYTYTTQCLQTNYAT